MGATRANDFTRQAHESGQAGDDHASLRTDPDDAERDTGIYGSEGWGFESLRARPAHRPSALRRGAFLLTDLLTPAVPDAAIKVAAPPRPVPLAAGSGLGRPAAAARAG